MATPQLDLPLRDDIEKPVETPVYEQPLCDSCPHPPAVHDRIAERFCEATLQMALTRRCICRGDMVDVEQAAASAHRFP
jgi:hypothetical protein